MHIDGLSQRVYIDYIEYILVATSPFQGLGGWGRASELFFATESLDTQFKTPAC